MLSLCSSLELKLDEVNALYSALLDFLWKGKLVSASSVFVKNWLFCVQRAVLQFLLSKHKSENDNSLVIFEGVLAVWCFFLFLIHV